jgi:acetyltransferase-like isoleucine patch superfamily enzyme
MSLLFRRLLSRLTSINRNCAIVIRRFWLRCRLGSSAVAADASIATGVRISVTDGARLRLANRVDIDRNATLIAKYGKLEIGPGTYVGTGSVLVAREEVIIGRDGLIAEYVTIRDQDHAYTGTAPTADSGYTTGPVRIGDNVWIGAKATITRGVRIGDNAVIGANSVVTGDIPANTVAAGCPARVIRQIRTVT